MIGKYMLLRLSTPGVFFFWDRFGRWRLIRNVIYCFQLARTGKLQPGSCLSVYPPGRSTRTAVIKNKIIIIMNSVGFCRSFYPPGRSTHTLVIKKIKIKNLTIIGLVFTLQETIVKKREKKIIKNTGPVRCLKVVGDILFSGSQDCTVRLHSLLTGAQTIDLNFTHTGIFILFIYFCYSLSAHRHRFYAHRVHARATP